MSIQITIIRVLAVTQLLTLSALAWSRQPPALDAARRASACSADKARNNDGYRGIGVRFAKAKRAPTPALVGYRGQLLPSKSHAVACNSTPPRVAARR